MSVVIETIRESRWSQGKQFMYLANIDSLAAGAHADIVISTTENGAIIESISVESDAEKLSWQALAGADIGAGGVEISAIPRNSLVDKDTPVTVTQNPTVNADGTPLMDPPINLVAQIFRNNSHYLDQQLVSSDFTFSPSLCYIIRLTNTSSDVADIQFSMGVSRR